MILIGQVVDPRLAQAFVDYMVVKGVQCQLQSEGESYSIWAQASDIEWAKNEFAQFAKEPLHPRYRSASWNRTDSSAVTFDYGASGNSLLHQIWVQAGPFTLSILTLCVGFWLISFVGLGNWLFSWLHFPAPLSTQWMEVWRFWAPAVLHVEPVHLLFNLVWWWYLGGRIEREVGSGQLFLLFCIGALLSNGLQGLWVGANFLGLSGVVYALLGYIAVVQKKRPELAVPPAYIVFMLIWMVLGFTGVTGINMANWAHLGGFLVGVAQGVMDKTSKT